MIALGSFLASIAFVRLRQRELSQEEALPEVTSVIKGLLDESEDDDDEDPCSGCEKKSLANTVKSYDKHLIVCGYEKLEQSHIETNNPFLERLDALMKGSKTRIKVTACNHPNSSVDCTDIIIYPDQIAVTLNPYSDSEVESLSKWLADSSNPLTLPNTKLPWRKLILVCHHAARDARCGKRGPRVIAELESNLRRRHITPFDVYVRASSHLGGHEFAGVVVVYPECDWYGYISKRNVGELLDCVIQGRRLEGCWRGRGHGQEW